MYYHFFNHYIAAIAHSRALLAGVALLSINAAGVVSGATIVSYDFASSTQRDSFTYRAASGSSPTTALTVSGGTLNFSSQGISRMLVSSFSTQSLEVGESLSLKFVLRSSTGAATVDVLRVGLFDLSSTTSDSNSSLTDTAFNSAAGYFFTAAPGGTGASAIKIFERTSPNDELLTASGQTNLGNSPSPGPGVGSGLNRDVEFTLTRTELGMTLTAVFERNTADTFTTFTAFDNAEISTTFDTFAIGFYPGGTGATYTIDNLEVSVVPEPSSALLTLGALAGCLWPRRSRVECFC